MTVHRTLSAATLALAGMTTATVVHAADRRSPVHVEVSSVVVRYGDLNLESERGVRQLQRRIVAAARQVCGEPAPRDLRLFLAARECVDQAVAGAVADVGNPRLARLSVGRAGAFGG